MPGCSNVTTATALSGRGHHRQAGVCILAEELPWQPQFLLCPHLPCTEGPSQACSHKSLLKQVCGSRWVPQTSNGVSFAWETPKCCCVTPSRMDRALSPPGGVSVSQVFCVLLGAGVCFFCPRQGPGLPGLCYSADGCTVLAAAGAQPEARQGLLGDLRGSGTGPLPGGEALPRGRTAWGRAAWGCPPGWLSCANPWLPAQEPGGSKALPRTSWSGANLSRGRLLTGDTVAC